MSLVVLYLYPDLEVISDDDMSSTFSVEIRFEASQINLFNGLFFIPI